MNMAVADWIVRIASNKPPEPPKTELRDEIQRQTEEYLARGGKITQIPAGLQTENQVNFTKAELIDFHKQRTRRRRGGYDKG
jgi:phosphoglycerate-specific signal transduction histidine kinase